VENTCFARYKYGIYTVFYRKLTVTGQYVSGIARCIYVACGTHAKSHPLRVAFYICG